MDDPQRMMQDARKTHWYDNSSLWPFEPGELNQRIKVTLLTNSAWNVCTLMDSARSDRPLRRTVVVGREFNRYTVEITALSKSRLAELKRSWCWIHFLLERTQQRRAA